MARVEQIGGERVNNRLLLAMSMESLDRLRPGLTPEILEDGQLIASVGEPVEYVYFVNRGFISLVKRLHDGREVEIGGVGVEGVSSPFSIMGDGSALFEDVVQVAGQAFRMRRSTLREAVAADPQLRALIEDYARFFVGEVGQTAACNRLHSADERISRWLLTAQDSALTDQFELTHEFLATMLGVHRSAVSISARALKRAGLIDYERGLISILDRPGLEETACECYQDTRDEMDRLFAAHDRPPSGAGAAPRR